MTAADSGGRAGACRGRKKSEFLNIAASTVFLLSFYSRSLFRLDGVCTFGLCSGLNRRSFLRLFFRFLRPFHSPSLSHRQAAAFLPLLRPPPLFALAPSFPASNQSCFRVEVGRRDCLTSSSESQQQLFCVTCFCAWQ
jgi:hypothetical protein